MPALAAAAGAGSAGRVDGEGPGLGSAPLTPLPLLHSPGSVLWPVYPNTNHF